MTGFGKNLSVTHKDNFFEIRNSIIQSVLYILRRLKAAGLQFALNLYKSTQSTVCSYVAEIPAILDGFLINTTSTYVGMEGWRVGGWWVATKW